MEALQRVMVEPYDRGGGPLAQLKKTMGKTQQFYDNYVTSGQAGVDHEDAVHSAHRKIASQLPYYHRFIDRHMPADRQSRILDVGCGHGSLIHALKTRGYYNISGVDLSPEQVSLAHSLGLGEVNLGDAETFLANEGDADVILCFDLLEHLTRESIGCVLRQAHETLKPGGLFIAHVPNGEGLFGQRIRYGDITHETCFTPKSIRQLLTSFGFRNIVCVEDRPVVHGIKSLFRRLLWDVGTFWPRLLLSAETGGSKFILSQNMLSLATRDDNPL